MISRHPRTLVDLLRLREGRREETAMLAPVVTVIPGSGGGTTPATLPTPTEQGDALVASAALAPVWAPQYADVEILLDGGGSIITPAAIKLDMPIDFACVVVGWSMFCDVAATARIDLWSDTYANFPPTIADTMPGADENKPHVTAAAKASGGVSGWTKTAIAAGDILRVNLDTNDLAKRIALAVKVRRT